MTKRITFQRRHYVAIADAIATCRKLPLDSANEAFGDLVEELVGTFKRDNPKFRPDQFRDAAKGGAQ